MGLRRPSEFTRKGRRLPGQSADEGLGLERRLEIKVLGQAAVVDWSLVQIGDVSAGNYIELGPNGIKIFNEGTELDIWAQVDSNIAQAEFRVAGISAADPDAYVGLSATDYAGTAQNSITLDTSKDRATIDAETVLIGEVLRFLGITTVARDALTAVNGMLIYNSTTDKFQGYAGGSWVDLH